MRRTTRSGRSKASSGESTDPNAVYALASSQVETDRVSRQADELAPISEALLERTGLGPGQSAIDLGCGPRGVLDLLAARVAPGGRVVGLDADPAHAAMAANFAASRKLAGVEVLQADARRTGLPSGSFDVVHARTLLINIPRPEEVVTEMVRLAKPGGCVAAMEPDAEYAMCYPPHPAFTRISEIFPAVFGRNGADPNIGRRVPEMLRRAGLERVGVDVRAQAFPPGHSRRTSRLDLVQSMRRQVMEMGLATEAELAELDAAARTHLDDPNTIVVAGLLVLSWGHKPL